MESLRSMTVPLARLEQVRAERPRLPLATFRQRLVIGPLGDSPRRDPEEAGDICVFPADCVSDHSFSDSHDSSIGA